MSNSESVSQPKNAKVSSGAVTYHPMHCYYPNDRARRYCHGVYNASEMSTDDYQWFKKSPDGGKEDDVTCSFCVNHGIVAGRSYNKYELHSYAGTCCETIREKHLISMSVGNYELRVVALAGVKTIGHVYLSEPPVDNTGVFALPTNTLYRVLIVKKPVKSEDGVEQSPEDDDTFFTVEVRRNDKPFYLCKRKGYVRYFKLRSNVAGYSGSTCDWFTFTSFGPQEKYIPPDSIDKIENVDLGDEASVTQIRVQTYRRSVSNSTEGLAHVDGVLVRLSDVAKIEKEEKDENDDGVVVDADATADVDAPSSSSSLASTEEKLAMAASAVLPPDDTEKPDLDKALLRMSQVGNDDDECDNVTLRPRGVGVWELSMDAIDEPVVFNLKFACNQTDKDREIDNIIFRLRDLLILKKQRNAMETYTAQAREKMKQLEEDLEARSVLLRDAARFGKSDLKRLKVVRGDISEYTF